MAEGKKGVGKGKISINSMIGTAPPKPAPAKPKIAPMPSKASAEPTASIDEEK